jgi:hypothetical protein
LYALQRKGGRPTGCKSAKSNMGRNPALAYSSNSDSEGERDDDDDDFDPTVSVLHGIFSNYLLSSTTYWHI